MSARPKLTYANVMVTLLAFVVLLGGGAYAADRLGKSSVGTKQLKRNAVTSAKVKNASLTGKDLASGVLGPASRGFQASGSVNFDSFSSSLFGSTVVSLAVPPGDYLATATIEAQTVNAVSSNVSCRLANGSTATSRDQVVRADTEPENFTLTALFAVTAGQALDLQCSKSVPGSSARIVTANVVAVEIGSVSGFSD
jgi:hypothetical protein